MKRSSQRPAGLMTPARRGLTTGLVLTITLVAFEALEHTESTEQAHMDGGQVVVERSSILVAVWDDRPARGLGGIADVVGYAGQRGIPVTIIWPEGASRD